MIVPFSFESLPDEIILHVCHYLRGADVFYSLYNLNQRLNVTLTGYCSYVNLMAVSYKEFEYAVSSVLPQIGSLVRTFVLNKNWETIINDHLSSILFGSQLPILFPQLQRLTIKWFLTEKLLIFVDTLRDMSELTELNIQSLKGPTADLLLTKVLSANNGRLTIVSFDRDSTDLNISETDTMVSYPNIEELNVTLVLSESLARLFLIVPNVSRLHVYIDELSGNSKVKPALINLPQLVQLTNFHLRSINLFWTFDELVLLLEAMPSLQQLSLDIRTSDQRFVSEESLLTIISSSLTKIDFFFRYYYSNSETIAQVPSISSSKRFPVVCLLDEVRRRFLIHTIPWDLPAAVLTGTISEQMLSGWKYTQSIEDLYLYDITSTLEILRILQHFRRVQTLGIEFENKDRNLTTADTQTPSIQLNLPFLQQIEISGVGQLYPILNVAPNVDYIILTFDCLKMLIDDKPTCHLFETRITRLNISEWGDVTSELPQRIAQVFTSLRHLVVTLNDSTVCIDDFILRILLLWKGRASLSLDVKGSLPDEITENLTQWLIDHSHIREDDSFAVKYHDSWFDFWF